MSRPEYNTVFVKIMSPVLPLLKAEADKLEKDARTYNLHFAQERRGFGIFLTP
jgi:hypothetical protein